MIRLRDRVQIGNPVPGSDNPLGNPSAAAIDWPAAPVEPAELQPLSTMEELGGQDTILERYRLLLCPVTAATGESLIRWRNVVWQVNGAVQPVPGARGRINHHTAIVERFVG
jgi:hypothetical protein